MDPAIVEAFLRTSRLHREDIFDDDRQMPLTATEDARTAASGWIGPDWAGGTLLVGINPGGGGDDHRRNPSDDRLYGLLRRLASTTDTRDATNALAALSRTWIDIQRGHNIWRIIDPILQATGERADQVAFINIVPFRTRKDAKPSARALQQAWQKAAYPQITALAPRRIIALGKKAWDVIAPRQLPHKSELILFRRGIGDSYIPPESQQVLRDLTARAGPAF